MEKPVIIIAESLPVTLFGLNCTLRVKFNVAALCGDGKEALSAIKKHKPKVALMDTELDILNGWAVAQATLANHRPTRVLFYTADGREYSIHRAWQIGAHGYMLSTNTARGHLDEIVKAVGVVAKGEAYWERNNPQRTREMQVAEYVARYAHGAKAVAVLTDREIEVALAIRDGASEKDIMSRLGVARSTLRTYMVNIQQKLGLNCRLQIARYADQNL